MKQSLKVNYLEKFSKRIITRYFTDINKAVKFYNKKLFGRIELIELVQFEMTENYEPVGWVTKKLFLVQKNDSLDIRSNAQIVI